MPSQQRGESANFCEIIQGYSNFFPEAKTLSAISLLFASTVFMFSLESPAQRQDYV
jgi:hypothetical protein